MERIEQNINMKMTGKREREREIITLSKERQKKDNY